MLLNPFTQAPADGAYEIQGDVMVHKSASIGTGCVLGPRVVIGDFLLCPGVGLHHIANGLRALWIYPGPDCVLGEGVRLAESTLLAGVEVRPHAVIKGSLIGWRCVVGRWSHVASSVFGEEVW